MSKLVNMNYVLYLYIRRNRIKSQTLIEPIICMHFSRDSELHHLTDSLKKIYLHIYLDKKSQAHLLL